MIFPFWCGADERRAGRRLAHRQRFDAIGATGLQGAVLGVAHGAALGAGLLQFLLHLLAGQGRVEGLVDRVLVGDQQFAIGAGLLQFCDHFSTGTGGDHGLVHRVLVGDEDLAIGACLLQFGNHVGAGLGGNELAFHGIRGFGHGGAHSGSQQQAGEEVLGNILGVHDRSL
ncbi:hypothetical protein Hsero_0043 [Herbaspirillum seropedicae SmR1]|uniref:Uncharacterized protein n=1 Tax=Herbaspirillum seropedicae (strain SmR1) TaxID=757424 RepID=D8ITT2_HERSS|nr:hypothetical protein Hsero_0043 [Herbaspirillum seropedicae SmR1]